MLAFLSSLSPEQLFGGSGSEAGHGQGLVGLINLRERTLPLTSIEFWSRGQEQLPVILKEPTGRDIRVTIDQYGIREIDMRCREYYGRHVKKLQRSDLVRYAYFGFYDKHQTLVNFEV